MIQVGFRAYDVEANDFPILVTASTEASALPDIAPVTFLLQDVNTGAVTSRTGKFHDNGDKTATLTIGIPGSPCNIVFAIQVRFPASNPADKPLNIKFVSTDNQKALDKILPGDLPIVFANYVMQFR